ncbi:hypothetical protein PoB_000644100 [Plakobranchus ocellatus]|uniref:Uncharacterized protein n=1 Tax=Plakobranchus ocellatus TaxID=259542 RepID=A0AAV3Y9M9_9GAST|nr:hypothetical protein PoB_000644100 [Plakobranchus ocellatus]
MTATPLPGYGASSHPHDLLGQFELHQEAMPIHQRVNTIEPDYASNSDDENSDDERDDESMAAMPLPDHRASSDHHALLGQFEILQEVMPTHQRVNTIEPDYALNSDDENSDDERDDERTAAMPLPDYRASSDSHALLGQSELPQKATPTHRMVNTIEPDYSVNSDDENSDDENDDERTAAMPLPDYGASSIPHDLLGQFELHQEAMPIHQRVNTIEPDYGSNSDIENSDDDRDDESMAAMPLPDYGASSDSHALLGQFENLQEAMPTHQRVNAIESDYASDSDEENSDDERDDERTTATPLPDHRVSSDSHALLGQFELPQEVMPTHQRVNAFEPDYASDSDDENSDNERGDERTAAMPLPDHRASSDSHALLGQFELLQEAMPTHQRVNAIEPDYRSNSDNENSDDDRDEESTAAMLLPDYHASSAIGLGLAGLHTQLPTLYFSRDSERPESDHTY